MEQVRDERVKQVAIAAGILMALAVVVSGLLFSWRLLPGVWGEWVGTMLGILTTPFFMEASFAILGLVIVITLNHWRNSRAGDEFVEIETLSETNAPVGQPESAVKHPTSGDPMAGN